MKHIKDIEYKGHEIVIIQDTEGEYDKKGTFIADIRADNFDGEMIAGYTGLSTAKVAEQAGRDYIDQLTLKPPKLEEAEKELPF